MVQQKFNPLFDVKEILLKGDQEKGTTKGAKSIQKAEANNFVNFDLKSLIKRRTVNFLVRSHTYYPPMNIKQNLAKCIASQMFSNLIEEQQVNIEKMFYNASQVVKLKNPELIGGDEINKRLPAAGLIEDRLKYIRQRDDVRLRSKAEKKKNVETEVASQDELEMKAWLSNSLDPAEQVDLFMRKTYRLRAAEIKKTADLSITLDEWPRLIDIPGMLDKDFSLLFPEKNELMLRRWQEISGQIIDYALKSNFKLEDHFDDGNSTRSWTIDQKGAAALLILPHLLASAVLIKRGNKRRKITSTESSHYFIQFVSANEDLESLRLSETIRQQPFVVCVGEFVSLTVVDAYVMLERKLIKATSIVSAVDLCFKVFHVMNVNSPAECLSVWAFFDLAVFKIKEIPSPPSSVLSISSQISV